jgi:uncharacterized protein (DUF736 family)
MATIGSFKQDGNDFTGAVQTLAFKAKLTIKAVDKASDTAPDYRVLAGAVEVGAAWSKVSKDGVPYISLKLDDPSFAAPIYANLMDKNDGTHDMIWSRSR